jgi:ATP-dependent helicase/nuclease subunit A
MMNDECRMTNGTAAAARRLTEEQAKAIGTRDVTVSLSSGAGCGKTFVLTERFLSHLEPGTNGAAAFELDELVAITFTDRAAREMRDRIRAKCYERLAAAPAKEGDYWLRLLRSLDAARVSTIHAFCAALLRSHAVEAGIDPRFAVLESAQAQTLLAELIDDVLRSKLAACDGDVLDLLVIFGLRSFREQLMDLHAAVRSHDFRRWLTMTPEDVVANWERYHRERVLPTLIEEFATSPAVMRVMEILRECTFENKTMRERQAVLLDVLPRIATSDRLAEDLEAVRQHAYVRSAGPKHWPSEELHDEFGELATGLREEAKALLGQLTIDPAAALVAARSGIALLKLAAEIDAAYDAEKSEQGVLDFDDLLIHARRLLIENPSVSESLARQNTLLLVDECQDTDLVQVEVINALCGDADRGGRLFFVGDYKQSIYRFRGADPRVFRALRDQTPEAGKLGLTKNFRSQPGILDFVNALFCDELGRKGGYDRLTAHREQMHPAGVVEFLWALPEGESVAGSDASETKFNGETYDAGSDDGKDAVSRRRREADWIARRIRRLLDDERDGDEAPLLIAQKAGPPRAVQAGDIAILFRALSNVQYYEEALRSYGIDYYLVGGHAFYAQQEIYDLLNLLRTIDCPADEISLAGVLRSPFFSLADETLFWLAEYGGLAAAFERSETPQEISEEQQARVKLARKVVGDLRRKKDRMPVAALINEALALTGFDAAIVGDFLGERKLANLRKLVEQARALERGGVMGLSDFIVQLSEFVVRQPKEPLAATQPESTNVVRLMTIHQAKGLEFPVVIVPDVGWTTHGGHDAVAFDPELGPLVRLPKDHPQAKALCGFKLHQVMCGDEDADEEIRLLYVATTRAADYLILSSSLQGFEKTNGPWLKLLAERFDLQTGRLAVKLPKGYAAPRVRVVRRQPVTATRPQSPYTRVELGKVVDEIEELAAAGRAISTPLVDVAPVDHAARRRFSISRLSGFDSSQPSWMFAARTADDDSGSSDPIGLGSLVHALLANVNLKERGDLHRLVEVQADKHGVWAQGDRDEALVLIERFMGSPRAKELAKAKRVLREVEFLLAWPLDGVGEQPRFLQGYLDCLYQHEGGWRVVDYKTNRVDKKNRVRLVAAYELQMLAYGLAAEQALGEPPVELVLHFLRDSSEHIFRWDDATRRRAIELVEQGIDRICRGIEAPQALEELVVG